MADPIQGFHLVANGNIEMSPPHHVLPEKPLGWQWALHLCGDSSLFGEEELYHEDSFMVWLTAASMVLQVEESSAARRPDFLAAARRPDFLASRGFFAPSPWKQNYRPQEEVLGAASCPTR